LILALKLALVDMYSRRLRERVRRKRVIRDYQLVAQFFKKDRPTTGKRFQAYEKWAPIVTENKAMP